MITAVCEENPETETGYLAFIYSIVFYVHILSQCRMKENSFKKDISKASVDLLRVKVTHSTIRSQLKMLKSSKGEAFENNNVLSPIIPRMPVLTRQRRILRARRIFRK